MQQGIILNFQANETPTYIAASDTSYINHPNLLLEPTVENPFGDPVPSSFFDTASSLRHLPIQCAKFQYGPITYFILSVLILTGLLRYAVCICSEYFTLLLIIHRVTFLWYNLYVYQFRFRLLYNRFRKTVKISQVREMLFISFLYLNCLFM